MADLVTTLLPMMIVSAIIFAVAFPISKRKGRGVGSALICVIPLVGYFYLLYLASLTDEAVLKRLSAIEQRPT